MNGIEYQVRTEVFEGPLDLLLHLIKKNEVDVYDIPVSAITDQYLSYLELMQEMNLDVAGEYLVMAATLAYIKSCMLLPPMQEDDEEEDAEELRQRLIEQLVAHQQFKEAAAALADRDILSRDVFTRPSLAPEVADGEVRLKDVSVLDLLEAFRGLAERKLKESFHDIVAEQVSVRECAEAIEERIRREGELKFADLFPPQASRLRWVATFVALLELVKEGLLVARQDREFGEIILVRRRHG